MQLTPHQRIETINITDLYADLRHHKFTPPDWRHILDTYPQTMTRPLKQALRNAATHHINVLPTMDINDFYNALTRTSRYETLTNWHLEQLHNILNPKPLVTLTIEDPGCGWHDSNKAITQHHAVNRKLKQAWRDKAHKIALHYVQPRPPWQPIERAAITYIVHRTSNRRSDADNVQPACKAIRDGLVNARLLIDDHDGIISRTSYERGENREVPTVTVQIYTPQGN